MGYYLDLANRSFDSVSVQSYPGLRPLHLSLSIPVFHGRFYILLTCSVVIVPISDLLSCHICLGRRYSFYKDLSFSALHCSTMARVGFKLHFYMAITWFDHIKLKGYLDPEYQITWQLTEKTKE